MEAEILFARGEPPVATYTFKHALIEETAYQSLLKRRRQQLHARVAQVLEESFPERVASEPEVIARHYEEAGLLAQASTHYQRAGERATRRSANEEAIGHLRRALDLVGTLPDTRERHQMELGLQMAIGAPLGAARGWSHSENELTRTRLRELASEIGESPELPRVLAGVAGASFVKGDLAASAEVAQEALAAAERTEETCRQANYTIPTGMGLWRTMRDSIMASAPLRSCPLCHVYLGHPDQALAASEATVASQGDAARSFMMRSRDRLPLIR